MFQCFRYRRPCQPCEGQVTPHTNSFYQRIYDTHTSNQMFIHADQILFQSSGETPRSVSFMFSSFKNTVKAANKDYVLQAILRALYQAVLFLTGHIVCIFFFFFSTTVTIVTQSRFIALVARRQPQGQIKHNNSGADNDYLFISVYDDKAFQSSALFTLDLK